MSFMFFECKSLISLPDLSKWKTSDDDEKIFGINYMNGLFCGCESLLSIPDISNWSTYSVKDISRMFE